MPALESTLRRQLENTIIQARDVAEAAARSALQKRAVDVAEPFPHFGPTEKDLRTRLRARGRQASDTRDADKTQSIDQLTQELAYEYWHRMLFARFLVENHLLMHPDGVAVSLEECEELAAEARPPAPNGFVLAARYASTMLPEIFRTDDVLLEIEFAPEQRLALEKLLASLPQTTFLAGDSLGWVYQFWQSKKKEEVNKSGKPIDGRTLSAVTQLFTEHYMVDILLHNTIGAWWAAKEGISPRMKHGSNTDEKPEYLNGIDPCFIRVSSVALPSFEYLRWRDDGTPAAGTFEGWPKTLAEFTMLDPCCGSGHFLVAAFNLLVPLRMHDEELTADKACEAVLRDNLFGLELDPRCTQIAAFALALAAWKYPHAGGFRRLPPLNIACSGQGVVGSKADWIKFANGDKNFTAALGFLYDEFEKAPTLGSLTNPWAIAESIFQTGFTPLRGSLDRALRKADTQADPDRAAVGVAAQGIAVAASLMARQFILVATNVPYLARGKQDETMRTYLGHAHSAAKEDLATAFVERCLDYCAEGGTTALVTPQNWWFLASYETFRTTILEGYSFDFAVALGEEAWQSFGIRGPRAVLFSLSASAPTASHSLFTIDTQSLMGIEEKIRALKSASVDETRLQQSEISKNPSHAITLESVDRSAAIAEYASVYIGTQPGQTSRLVRHFWEMDRINGRWVFHSSSPSGVSEFDGNSEITIHPDHFEEMEISEAVIRGRKAWGHAGVIISKMRKLHAGLYVGSVFDDNACVLIPKRPEFLPAI